MGTRAAFFIGDARDVENREWLGCIAWNGYPDGDCKRLADAATENAFRVLVQSIADERDDFCDPKEHGFPFPWTDNLFATDCVYSFIDGRVYVEIGKNWWPLRDVLEADEYEEFEHKPEDPTFKNVPAPTKEWDRSGPDSIMYVRLPQ